MPRRITKGSAWSEFVYGPEHQRAKQTRSDGLVVYQAGAQEVEVKAGQVTVKTYWPGGVGLEIDKPGQATALYWTHTDRLGSVMALSNAGGALAEKLAYDAWGKRRELAGSATPDTLDGVVDRRGFTGHEMLDALDLVHMNGRVYDPLVARFISADPILQDPEHSQSYNRYSYVWNNPTNLTDPSGFEANCTLGKVQSTSCVKEVQETNRKLVRGAMCDGSADVLSCRKQAHAVSDWITQRSEGRLTEMPLKGQNGGGRVTPGADSTAEKDAGDTIRGLRQAFEGAQASGDIAGMETAYGQYVDVAGLNPGSQMRLIAWGSVILRARSDAGLDLDGSTLATTIAAGSLMAATSSAFGPGAKGDDQLFRGGQSLGARLGVDVKAAADGLIYPLSKNGKPQGLSLNLDPKDKFIQQYGGAFPVNRLPEGLQALQSGKAGHYVVAPAAPMPFEKYQQLLNQIQLGNFNVLP